MIFDYIRSFMYRRRRVSDYRAADLQMQRQAQVSIDARLTRLELAFKNKTRIK